MSDTLVTVYAKDVPKGVYDEFKIICIRHNMKVREGIIAAMKAVIDNEKKDKGKS